MTVGNLKAILDKCGASDDTPIEFGYISGGEISSFAQINAVRVTFEEDGKIGDVILVEAS